MNATRTFLCLISVVTTILPSAPTASPADSSIRRLVRDEHSGNIYPINTNIETTWGVLEATMRACFKIDEYHKLTFVADGKQVGTNRDYPISGSLFSGDIIEIQVRDRLSRETRNFFNEVDRLTQDEQAKALTHKIRAIHSKADDFLREAALLDKAILIKVLKAKVAAES